LTAIFSLGELLCRPPPMLVILSQLIQLTHSLAFADVLMPRTLSWPTRGLTPNS
jgi:hypothetical protein